MLVAQVINSNHKVEIQYRRVARMEGNPRALAIMNDVFEPCDDVWRGLGMIKDSGLKIRQKYSSHDAIKQLYVDVEKTIEPKGCICGLILQGRKKPPDCRLFASQCTPQNPIGACMVSSEGTCE